jgi:CxxC motif-containing protein (DUF1111 family)
MMFTNKFGFNLANQKQQRTVSFLSAAIIVTMLTGSAFAGARDPGVRGGAVGAGQPLPGLNANELALFNNGKFRMTEVEATCDTCGNVPPGSPGGPGLFNSAGLGARFNGTQCASCHSQPAIGGSSPAVNPQIDMAHERGATNTIPSFLSLNGPVREVRFAKNPDGTPDGGVHALFTVKGRSDAPNCNISQPDFETEFRNGNAKFRIPTPEFGLGLVEAIQDKAILANMSVNASQKAALGIKGAANRNDNDGTITRFGWKAQNKSLMMFSGEAYNVEMGVTNELFQNARDETPTCNLGAEPNDVTRTDNDEFNKPTEIMADWVSFALFMRFLDAPKPAALSASAQRGQTLFSQVGCAHCHTPSFTTMPAPLGPQTVALQGKTVNLYSDLLIHHMGAGLADDITQGRATGDMFRSAPLWGLGQRIFFLHDGRTNDLLVAIQAHSSQSGDNQQGNNQGNGNLYPASEANGVVNNFNALNTTDQQAILDFLRSL